MSAAALRESAPAMVRLLLRRFAGRHGQLTGLRRDDDALHRCHAGAALLLLLLLLLRLRLLLAVIGLAGCRRRPGLDPWLCQ